MLAVGKLLSNVISGIASGLSVLVLMVSLAAGPPTGPGAWLDDAWLAIGFGVATPAAVVVHECGHLLACLVLRVKVRGIRIGRPDRRAFRFRVAGVTVALGAPWAGQVEHGPVPSRWRTAIIVMAGSLADLVMAGALLAAGLAGGFHLSHVPVHEAIELSVAVLAGGTGIASLLPHRSRWGRLSDGARLLALGNGRLGRALRQGESAVKGPDLHRACDRMGRRADAAQGRQGRRAP